jgi:putative sterol carrier protein
MAVAFGSQDWADALVEELNGSSEYRNAAKSWGVDFNGNLLFVFEAGDGLPASVHLLIRLRGGSCSGAEFIPDGAHPDAGFVLLAPYSLWRDVLARKTLAATAILTGRLRVQGENKMILLKHTAAKRALIYCAASIDTDW